MPKHVVPPITIPSKCAKTWQDNERYTNHAYIDEGAFGRVRSANDTLTNKKVAIKMLKNPFKSQNPQSVYREIMLLNYMKHENIISLLDVYMSTPRSLSDSYEIYIVTEYMPYTLRNRISQNMCNDTIKYLFYQILCGLKYLHSIGIIHYDLKPENITVNEKHNLKIIDFGSVKKENETSYSGTTLSYRAPEIIWYPNPYSKSSDMWSIGCILAEMYTKKTLILSDDDFEHVEQVIELFGYPTEKHLQKMNSNYRLFLNHMSFKNIERIKFNEYFSEIPDSNAIDLLDKILQLDPTERITCKEALEHQFLCDYSYENNEPFGIPLDDNFDCTEHTLEEWKEEICSMISNISKTVKV